jgi:predicted AAA+ superfamily ATPase
MISQLFELSRQMVTQNHRPFRRYLMGQDPFASRCTLLTGQRGVGKTTCLVQHLVDRCPDFLTSKRCLYLPVDHFVVAQKPVFEIATDFVNGGGELLCLDEVHKSPTWSRDLKSILDTLPSLKVVASGSSMLQLHKGSHDLSRRVLVQRLEGLSFREYLAIRHGVRLNPLALGQILTSHELEAPRIVEELRKGKLHVLAEFRDYLCHGFYPFFLQFGDRKSFLIALEQSIHAVIEGDLPSIHPAMTGNSVARIKRLLSALAANVPYTPDLIKLRGLLGIADDRTLKDYLQCLQEAGLVMAISKPGKALRSMEKPDRIYLGDPNIAHALAATGEPDLGSLRETFFCRMVSSRHGVASGGRADFLVDGKITIEVGGKNKGQEQLAGKPNAYLALDDLPVGSMQRIPLWLFGFLY